MPQDVWWVFRMFQECLKGISRVIKENSCMFQGSFRVWIRSIARVFKKILGINISFQTAALKWKEKYFVKIMFGQNFFGSYKFWIKNFIGHIIRGCLPLWGPYLDWFEPIVSLKSSNIYGSQGPGREKVDEMSLFFKVRSWYGQIKAKIDIILSPSSLSYLGKLSKTKFQVLGVI